MRLNQTLDEIKQASLVSFFMPGHKMGRDLEKYFQLDLAKDITEIPGADYLHDAQGTILETEKGLSRFYGSSESKMLINGSTVGILSMILGSLGRGEKLILNRNAHKSVYHAISLGGIEPVYLYPDVDPKNQLVKSLSYDALKSVVETNRDAKAILLTYPTYEGVCYEIEKMITLCHQFGIAVLVDEAHGAHLKLSESLPRSALDLGADVVVQSFHKTLPSMTQTAGLHFGKETTLTKDQIDHIKWHLSVLQTSSPSYVLMGSIDGMLSMVEDVGSQKMERLIDIIGNFETQMTSLKNFELTRYDHMDPTKLIISTKKELINLGYTGTWLSDELRNTFKIQVEYATTAICLLMPSISNNQEDFDRLFLALKTLDERKDWKGLGLELSQSQPPKNPVVIAEKVCTPYEAQKLLGQHLPLHESLGKVSKQYIIPYPPGIPIVVPGERITKTILEAITYYKNHLMTLPIEGILVAKLK